MAESQAKPASVKAKQMHQCKVVMLGDQAVGKSSIINRYIKNEFDSVHNPTIGIDFLSRSITVNGKTIRLQLWDTAGQQRFRSLVPGYLKNSVAVLIVFDVSSEASFEQLNSWIDMVKEVRGNEAKMYLIANKRDLKEARKVELEQIVEFANREGLKFYEVSAKDGDGVAQMFLDICGDLAKMELPAQPRASRELTVSKEELQARQSCC